MTSQNPASPNSQTSPLDRDTLAKVNAHADRAIERLFVDIDELLDGDLDNDPASSAVVNRSTTVDRADRYPNELQPQLAANDGRSDFSSSRSEIESVSAKGNPQQQKKRLPLWFKIASGIGVSTLAVGGGLLWLVNAGKIELPKTLDTSWLPFQSNARVAPADAKFAEYMQKSLAKIESTRAQAPTPIAPTTPATDPATTQVPTTPATAANTLDPAGTVSVAPTQEVATPQTPISLLKTFSASRQPSASFKIADRDLKIAVGQKIGTSGWSLMSVSKGEVLLKKTGGEIRSIRIGQKF
jgi:hypothetical protein